MNVNDRAPTRRLRFRVLQRDNYTCQACGRSAPEVKLHIDHILPWSKGGLTTYENLQVLCQDCNLGKSDSFDITSELESIRRGLLGIIMDLKNRGATITSSTIGPVSYELLELEVATRDRDGLEALIKALMLGCGSPPSHVSKV